MGVHSRCAMSLKKPSESFELSQQNKGEIESFLPTQSQDNRVESSEKSGMSAKTVSIAIGASLAIATILIVAILIDSLHKVEEGHVGIYFTNGALGDTYTKPGINFKAPFISRMVEINVRPQTENIDDFDAVTKDGISNRFSEIQIISDVNVDHVVDMVRKFGMEYKRALIFDRVVEEVRTYCAGHTIDEVYNTKFLEIVEVVKAKIEDSIKRLAPDGIKILNLVIPKPDIPPDIAKNYKEVKVQWTKQLVAQQEQKTESIKKETEELKAVADAQREKSVLKIEVEKQILEKEGKQKLSYLENEIIKAKDQNKADVEAYAREKEAEANKLLYTPEFVQLHLAERISDNTKFYFSGQDSIVGSLLDKVLDKKEL